MQSSPVPRPDTRSPVGAFAAQAIRNILSNPLFGTTVYHYRAELAPQANFNDRGQPDYLGASPGHFASGVVYTPNPNNPLKGAFCQIPRKPVQEVSGIYYQATHELIVLEDLGLVYELDGQYPKRQDAFDIAGYRWYATGPATPCQQGDVLVGWKIELNLERYPVRN